MAGTTTPLPGSSMEDPTAGAYPSNGNSSNGRDPVKDVAKFVQKHWKLLLVIYVIFK